MDSEIKVAPCGLLCSRCDAYRATQSGDEALLEKVAAHWRELNHCDDIKAEFLHCDGCMTGSGCKSFFCSNLCAVRKCVVKHNVPICSDCPEFDGCTTWSGFFQYAPEAQVNAMKELLEAVRKTGKNMSSVITA